MSKFREEVNIQNQKKNANKLGEECQNKHVVQINACILFKIDFFFLRRFYLIVMHAFYLK